MVLAAPVERRTASIRKRARQLASQLTTTHFQAAPLAREMCEGIGGFCLPSPARPSGPDGCGRVIENERGDG